MPGVRGMRGMYGLGMGLGLVTVTSSPAITTIANTIAKTENTNPALNNPGDLMYAGQPGATGQPGQLAQFDTYDSGYQAMLRQIQLDANNGMTISQMMESWAPAGVPGNDPTAYAGYVAGALGVGVDTTVSSVFGGTAGQGTGQAGGSTSGTGSGVDGVGVAGIDWGAVVIAVGGGAAALFLLEG